MAEQTLKGSIMLWPAQEADLSDTANVLSSPGLENFARSNNLLPAGEPFNFFKAFHQVGCKGQSSRGLAVGVYTQTCI